MACPRDRRRRLLEAEDRKSTRLRWDQPQRFAVIDEQLLRLHRSGVTFAAVLAGKDACVDVTSSIGR